jgi:hypothetical protein
MLDISHLTNRFCGVELGQTQTKRPVSNLGFYCLLEGYALLVFLIKVIDTRQQEKQTTGNIMKLFL